MTEPTIDEQKAWIYERKRECSYNGWSESVRMCDAIDASLERLKSLKSLDAQTLAWRCNACRQVGALHCAHPEDCGNMRELVDRMGEVCSKCNKGHYAETSQQDDMDGVLHCDECGHRVTRRDAEPSPKEAGYE